MKAYRFNDRYWAVKLSKGSDGKRKTRYFKTLAEAQAFCVETRKYGRQNGTRRIGDMGKTPEQKAFQYLLIAVGDDLAKIYALADFAKNLQFLENKGLDINQALTLGDFSKRICS
jgi:hypothetical protein